MKRLEMKISISQAWNTCDMFRPGKSRVIARVLNSIGFDEPIELFGRKFRKDGTCVVFVPTLSWNPELVQILEEVTRKYFLPQPAVGQACDVSLDGETWLCDIVIRKTPCEFGGFFFGIESNPEIKFRYIRPTMFWNGTTEPFTVETIDGEPDSYYVTWEVA